MRRQVAGVACLGGLAVLLWSAPAMGQTLPTPDLPELQLQRMRPATGPGDFIGVYGTPIPKHLEWDIGFYLDFADDPLQIAASGRPFSVAVDSQVTLSLMANIGIKDLLEFGVLVPVTLLQTAGELEPIMLNDPKFSSDEIKRVGVNDPRLTGKIRVLDNREDPLGLAFIVGLTLPFATDNTLTSDDGVGAEVIAAADKYLYKGIRVGANLGYRHRAGRRLLRENTIGNEVTWGLGLQLPLFTERLDGVVEIDGAVGVAEDQTAIKGFDEGEVNAELRAALRYKLRKWMTLTVGVGFGLSEGVGTPDYRPFVSLGGQWVTGGSFGYDMDGDGMYGDRDLCPGENEDYDGHEDDDGCPDYDNDNDGVPDTKDKCDNTPPGVPVREDGCPDDDIDGDGIPNKLDQCPEDAEDRDRFQDGDGCPDPDNDSDGIPDTVDECPIDPETKNGFLDEDGCPDDPNEKVVVTKNKIIITEPVYFATGKDTILKQSYPILNEVARVLEENPRIKLVRVEGHTDDRGNDDMNQKLSQRRANSVRTYLINKGIDRDRLEAVGYGETRPIAENETGEGRAKNRRVEFIIVD
jgi:outer membrane protein OmpA-like peptidoglycan-associated protein